MMESYHNEQSLIYWLAAEKLLVLAYSRLRKIQENLGLPEHRLVRV